MKQSLCGWAYIDLVVVLQFKRLRRVGHVDPVVRDKLDRQPSGRCGDSLCHEKKRMSSWLLAPFPLDLMN